MFACLHRGYLIFLKVILESNFFIFITKKFELPDLSWLFSSISFSSIFFFPFFVLTVILGYLFLSLFLKDFKEVSAWDKDLIILQHKRCVYNATETVDVWLNITDHFFKNINSYVTSDFTAEMKLINLTSFLEKAQQMGYRHTPT